MKYSLILITLLVLTCQIQSEPKNDGASPKNSGGALFIIGGGERPPELIQELIDISSIDKKGYLIILPMASSEPDTSAYYAIRQFTELGIDTERCVTFNLDSLTITNTKIDSLKNAQLIYITGGDQSKFMRTINNTEIRDAIQSAFNNDATIAGTSAGAALMSEKMITGDEKKHPEYTGDFRTIEADNIILKEGLGLLKKVIVDQHFVYRMRMNRLVTVALENPEFVCLGIDESTAVVFSNNLFHVVGNGQVIVIKNYKDAKVKHGLIGGRDLKLDVLLDGDTLEL